MPLPEDIQVTAARDIASAIHSSRTGHAIINKAITSNPDYVCRCDTCLRAEATRSAARNGESRPFVWTVLGLGKDNKFPANYFCYLTSANGVSVKVSGKDPREVVRIANSIEKMEVTR